jgi:transcriptional regulator with XRE-family HTH domain
MPKTSPVAAPTIALGQGWYRELEAAGYTTDAQIAVAMGIDPATVFRIQKGDGAPSAKFIAAALTVFGSDKFNVLFAVVAPKAARRAA